MTTPFIIIKKKMNKAKDYTSKFIREYDMFGHVVNLNFDMRGDSHQTVCGGLFSLSVRGFLTFYVALLLKKLFLKENDTNFSTTGLIDLEQLGPVAYNEEMHMKFFHVIRK